MKKLFTLVMLALLTTVTASAQSTLRKTWDFRDGFSAKTVNALKADQEEFGGDKYWRNYESDANKADDQHFWNASTAAKNGEGYACTHNSGQEKVIPELEGLVLGMSAAKKFVITYNGGQTANTYTEGGLAAGEMVPHGKSYVWLNGKNETIKFNAEVGQTIKIAVESHAVNATKLGEARGISLSASSGSLTPKFDGSPVPTYYTEYEWDLAGNPGEVVELTLKSTNGCHIYYIIVGEGDDPNANKTKVAYITNGDATTEAAYQALAADENLLVTPVAASEVSVEGLKANTITVISPELPADNAAVAILKEALSFTPILNLNAGLYAAWGYGEAVDASQEGAIINLLKNDILAGFQNEVDYFGTDEDGYFVILSTGKSFKGIKLGEYFADDAIVATDPADSTVVGIHVHNTYHNAYVYFPADAITTTPKLLTNAIDLLKSSKSEITQAPAPKIKLDYKDQKTNISIAMASSNLPKPHIYYTLDGSVPTVESNEYTEPLTVTSETTVKAVAIAQGYLLSDVAEAKAEIFSQPAAPSIATEYNDGATTVTLASATENVAIWYNYSENNDTVKSMKYTEPIVIKEPTDLTAFAVVNGQVFSELATQRIVVKNAVVRQDQVAMFDANPTDWQQGGSGSTVYYFSWGKNARSIYDTSAGPIGTTEDPETGDVTNIYPEQPYEYYIPAAEGNVWEVKSKGQVMIWQSISVGTDFGNGEGYNPETSGDIITYAKATNNDIQFGGKTSGESCTGAIQSLKKFQGPFDIVTIVGTAAGGDNVGRMQLQVSTDSINWENLGEEMATSKVKRLWKSYTNSYNNTDEVYVRLTQAGGGSSVQIYNIYILNEGENSLTLKQQYDAEWEAVASGIETVNRQGNNTMKAVYNLNGILQNGLQRGLNIVVMGDGTVKKVAVK